jgi:hypothetical protein
MAAKSWLHGLTRKSRRPARKPTKGPRRPRPLALEQLEDRTVPSLGLGPDTWAPQGPAPINVAGATPSTGRITGLAVDPSDSTSQTIYVAAAGGGVWKTTDGGASWKPLTDGQPTLFMGSIALAPSDPKVIYAGTGEANNSGDSYYGLGVLKSTNGGLTWALETGNGPAGSGLTNQFNRRAIGKIVVSPTDPNTVYAAVSPSPSNGVAGNGGVWKSTDGGATWVNTTAKVSTADAYSDLVMDPTHPQTLYAAVVGAGRQLPRRRRRRAHLPGPRGFVPENPLRRHHVPDLHHVPVLGQLARNVDHRRRREHLEPTDQHPGVHERHRLVRQRPGRGPQ